MCQSQFNDGRESNSNWQEHARRQNQLYPNLDEILNNILPENQSEFLRQFFSENLNHGNNNPSAPPQENVGPWQMPPQNENRANQNGNRPDQGGNGPDQQNSYNNQRIREEIFAEIGQYFKQKMKNFIFVCSLFMAIVFAPNCLLQWGIFCAIMKTLDMPLMPLIVAGFSFMVLNLMHPTLLTLLALWAAWKVFVQKQKLFPFWTSRRRC